MAVRSWRIPLIAAGACVALSCAHRRADRDPVRRAVRASDDKFAARADLAMLDAAIDGYLALLADYPDHPLILGKLTRAYALRTYGFGDGDPDGYITAREYGLRCLMLQPAFAGLVRNDGGRVLPAAVDTIPPEASYCLVWTTFAWSRWLEERGAGGAGIDLAAVESLGRRAMDVAPEFGQGRTHAAAGLALSVAPAPLGPDLEAARGAFEQARALSPGRLSPVVDLATLVHAPLGEREAWQAALELVLAAQLASDDPDLLENRRAQVRAAAALEAGMDAAVRWRRPVVRPDVPAARDEAPPMPGGVVRPVE